MKFIVTTVLCIVIINNNIILALDGSNNDNNDEVDPSETKEEDTYPYMVAILKKTTFISAGALIDEKWVVTAADSFFLIREAVRTLRVRLGSPNYKYGGTLTAVKYLQIHPNFDDSKPEFNIALIRLSETVKLTPNLNPIKLQTKLRNITSSHFTVTGWHSPNLEYTKKNYVSKESLQQRQLLTVSHLHPTNKNDCLNQLEMLEVNNTDTIMCLDWAITDDPCERETGAAVALNGVLWGIVSSWKSEDCDVDKGSLFVTRVSPVKIGSWIHSTIHGHRWSQKHTVDYRDNFF